MSSGGGASMNLLVRRRLCMVALGLILVGLYVYKYDVRLISYPIGGQSLHGKSNRTTTATTTIGTSKSYGPVKLSDTGISTAMGIVLDRRKAYANASDDGRWKLRGLGYLYSQKGLVLAATLVGGDHQHYRASQPEKLHHQQPDVVTVTKKGRHVVQIQNVWNDPPTTPSLVGDQCELLTMWVRVNGPEIFSGRPRAIQPQRLSDQDDTDRPCYWEYSFDLQVPGRYEIDVKLLVWNGNVVLSANEENRYTMPRAAAAMSRSIQCRFEMGGPDAVRESVTAQQQYPYHVGFRGFKFYGTANSCCEICTRLSSGPQGGDGGGGCKHWATPPDEFPDASFLSNGCELYYDNVSYVLPLSKLLPQRKYPVMKLQPPPSPAITNRTTRIDDAEPTQEEESKQQEGEVEKEETHRHYRRRHRRRRLGDVPQYHGDPHTNPTAYFMGCGWSTWFTLDYPCLSADLDDRVYVETPTFVLADTNDNEKDDHQGDLDGSKRRDPEQEMKMPEIGKEEVLPLCSLDNERIDDESTTSGRWVRFPFPDKSICPNPFRWDANFKSRFRVSEFDGNHPQCWHRDDFHEVGKTCVEMNCRFIEPESKWTSSLHDEQKWFGVWKPYTCDYVEFTNDELQQCIDTLKIQNVLADGASIAEYAREYLNQRLQDIKLYEGSDGKNVILSTLALLHTVETPNVDFRKMFHKSVPDKAKPGDDIYIMSSYFLSSEREIHCHVDRLDFMSRRAYEELVVPNHQGKTKNITEESGVIDHVTSFHWNFINSFDMSAAFTFDTATQMDGMHIIGPPLKMTITKFFHHVCKDVIPDAQRVGSGTHYAKNQNTD